MPTGEAVNSSGSPGGVASQMIAGAMATEDQYLERKGRGRNGA